MNTVSGQNDTRLKDLMAEARELGREMAAGKDSLPNFALKVAYAANDGVISTQKDKDGADDANRLYAEFMAAASKKAVHEHTTGGIKANTSKLRQIMVAATKTTCDFPDVLKRLVNARKVAISKEEKVQSAFPAMVSAARMQNEQDDDLTDAQIGECISKPEAEAPDVEKVLASVEKKLSELISGKNGIQDKSDETVQAHGMIRTRLAALVQMRESAEVLAKAAALGLTVVSPAPQQQEMLQAAE